jgi:hypothetical protein
MRDKAPFLWWNAFHQIGAMDCFQHLLENLKQQKNECQTVNAIQGSLFLEWTVFPSYVAG